MGWNTLTLKTTVRPAVKDRNVLWFDIGPARRNPKTEKEEIEKVLWRFENESDWTHEGGKVEHRSKPGAKEVTLTFRLFFAGLKTEAGQVREGDYVLHHGQFFKGNPYVTSTVSVNGTPLTTFLGQAREELVITPLLRQGRNEIKVVSFGVTGLMERNKVEFKVAGPAEYSARQKKYLVKTLLNFHGNEGWEQDEKSGLWHVAGKPQGDRLERVIPLDLAEVAKR
jgi:hypothetical protein